MIITQKFKLIILIAVILLTLQPITNVSAFSLPKAILLNFNHVNISVNPARVEPDQLPYSSTKIAWLLSDFNGQLIINVYGLRETNNSFILIYKGFHRVNCLIGQGVFGEYTITTRPRPPLLDPVYRLQVPFWQYTFRF